MATIQTPVGIFLMDDDKGIRELLREKCPGEYQFLGEAANCQEARDKLPELVSYKGILVAILDGSLPDGRGQDIALEFTKARPDTLVVSLSAMTLRQTWGHANFRKPVSMPILWQGVGALVSQTGKYR